MPKESIHPKMNAVNCIMPSGFSIVLPMCYSKSDIHLESDVFYHQAWKDKRQSGGEGLSMGKVAQFRKMYSFNVSAVSAVASNNESTSSKK